jgi:glycosyltransferase involved in cell wall biosynthesis
MDEIFRSAKEINLEGNPLISVIIPLYNSGKRFIHSLKCVIGQTYRPIEVLLIDDGSTDCTSEFASEFVRLNDNVHYYRKENGGVGSARNFGIEKASGEYFALCDHDDLWHSTKLEKQIRFFSDPGVGLVYTGANFIEASDSYDMEAIFAPVARPYYEGKVYYDLLKLNIICASSTLFSRAALDQVGLFEESIKMHGVDDKHMWLRISHEFQVKAVKEILTCWVMSDRNWSKNEDKMMQSALFCLEDIVRRFPETTKHGSTIVNEAFCRIYLHFGLNHFNGRDLGLAKKCFLNVLKRKPLSPMTLAYYISSFLPPAAVKIIAKSKRAIFPTANAWYHVSK